METTASVYSKIKVTDELPNTKRNGLTKEDLPIHDWYRFVLSYPPQLVRKYLVFFGVNSSSRVLDPFPGTGTTNVECKLQGIENVGIESNPFPYFASKVKVNWNIDPDELIGNGQFIAEQALDEIKKTGVKDSVVNCSKTTTSLLTLPPASEKLLIKDSISPLPKHKAILLLRCIRQYAKPEYLQHLELAFAKTLVFKISNLAFGPEVGIGKIKTDAEVVSNWLSEVKIISDDIRSNYGNRTQSNIYQLDSRELSRDIENNSIDYVITSPPYPNEKDYTRTTRLESVFLGFINNQEDLRDVKRGLVRSNTRNIYKYDDDYKEIEDIPEIMLLAEEIENKRLQLGKTSGFERQYFKVTRNYFGGMALHLKDLRKVLKPGAKLAYVVGDQASYFRVMIKTGELLGIVARKYGYEVNGLDLFRTRLATATRAQLREEVLLLRWPG